VTKEIYTPVDVFDSVSDVPATVESEAITHFKQGLSLGRPWQQVLLESIGMWTRPHETWQDREYRYVIQSEAFDWLLLAERLCAEVGEGTSYKAIVTKRVQPSDKELQDDDLLDLWIRKNSATSHHISSTCRMGPESDLMAVVDQYGKVHGIENLRVADASIMHDCVRANTNVPSMMVGEKVAEFIMQGK